MYSVLGTSSPRLCYTITSCGFAEISLVTKQIRLTSATSVVSTLDPVHLFEDFATLDLISGCQAEIIAGKGAFIESFSLFGYNLDDYDELFEGHKDLLLRLNSRNMSPGKESFVLLYKMRRLHDVRYNRKFPF